MAEYSLKNGILYRDGKPTFAIGTSYYASYHPQKETVPAGGDKFGEMKLDVADIAAAGFNNIRTASIGKSAWEGETLVSDTAFTDAMIAEADARGVAMLVRLNGYTMNFHEDEPNRRPLDQFGKPMPPLPEASCFVQQPLCDEELNRESDTATRQLAAHYGQFPAVVGFQIYNEPSMGYSKDGTFHIYDYRPETLAAFRVWLAAEQEKFGLALSAEEIAALPAPLPNRQTVIVSGGKTVDLYPLWRLFGILAMSQMLCRTNRAAREGAPRCESFTNVNVLPFTASNHFCEASFFDCADGMDIIGIDSYSPLRGEGYYNTLLRFEQPENAAASRGKHAWLPEVCCRTHMTVEDYEREAYAAVGTGYTGISYYLWRGDLGGPEVQLGGMVWNDRTKTAKFDEAVKVNYMLQKHGEEIVSCERVRDGVGILYSLYATAQTLEYHNKSFAQYAELRKLGVSATFVPAKDLAQNPLGIRLLFVPVYNALSAEEKAMVDDFAKTHAVVLAEHKFAPACGNEMYGVSTQSTYCYRVPGTLGGDHVDRRSRFLTEELLEMSDVRPLFRVRAKKGHLDCFTTVNRAEKYYIVSVLNIATHGGAFAGAYLEADVAAGEPVSALYIDRSREEEIPAEKSADGFRVPLPYYEGNGGFMVKINYR